MKKSCARRLRFSKAVTPSRRVFAEPASMKNAALRRHFLYVVRPAWAQSWRCKSSRELTTANEAKRNCVRVTERGEEAWSEA
ncbi:MAG: hypothetical protein VB137_15580, partial [Burkholderia sp.]